MRVLIVEDEPIIALELESIVLDRLPDAEVVLATSVCAAMAEIDETLRLAFLDVDVADGKTFPLALKLRECDVPFAFVSGADSKATPPELLDATFLAKPFSAGEIIRSIDEAEARDEP